MTEPAPISNVWTAGYKSTGQIASWTDPLQHQTTFTYASSTEDLTAVTDPMGNKTALSPDSVGRDTSVTTPMLETSSYEYNALNRVTSATDPNGKTTTFSYDLMGNLTTLTDPLNHATTWSYTPPLGDSWDVQECDPANNCNEAHLNWLSGLPGWRTRPASRRPSPATRSSA